MYETHVPTPKKESGQNSLTEKNIQINTSIEDFFDDDKKYDAEYFDYLLERIEDLGLGEKRDALEDRLIQDVYDKKTQTLAQACQELEDYIEKRKKTIEHLRAGLSLNEEDLDVITARMNMVHDIDQSTIDQRLFLGSGNIARVYKLDDQPGLCVKKIYNDAAYAKENSVAQEHDFMDALSGFEVEGVRTPFVKETISGGGLTVIVMEELNAVNFELAATGKAPIPQDFDLEDFFQRLRTYITKMHDEKGIAHKDLAPRNVMICNKTGKPFVIDFGRSEYLANAKNADVSREKDLAGLEASKALMRKFLTDKS